MVQGLTSFLKVSSPLSLTPLPSYTPHCCPSVHLIRLTVLNLVLVLNDAYLMHFYLENLESRFNGVGFTTSIVKYNTRELRNRKRKLSMYRCVHLSTSLPLCSSLFLSLFFRHQVADPLVQSLDIREICKATHVNVELEIQK